METETVTRKDVESIFVKLFDEREALSAQARPEPKQESKQESEMGNVPKSMELLVRVVRVEEEIKHLISAIQEMQRSTDKRFEDMQHYMDKRFEGMDKRFKAVLWSIGVCFGVLTATMIGLFGVIINMLG